MLNIHFYSTSEKNLGDFPLLNPDLFFLASVGQHKRKRQCPWLFFGVVFMAFFFSKFLFVSGGCQFQLGWGLPDLFRYDSV
jgi:hypothetical protein